MHAGVHQFVMPRCDDAGNTRINVKHHNHWQKEGATGRIYDVSFILIVTALVSVTSSRLIPIIIWIKLHGHQQ